MKQYAYELYGFEFTSYIPAEWSSMYASALERYESYLEFGLVPIAPDTFRVENMSAEQNGNNVTVYFDVVWFEVNDSWEPVKDVRKQSAVFEFLLMTEHNHSFLRNTRIEFSD